MNKRLPPQHELVPVFSVIATFAYGWSLVVFFYKIPSFVLFATPRELFGIASYVLLAALLESLTVLGVLVLIGFVLPQRMFLESFLVRTTWGILLLYTSMMAFTLLNAGSRDTFMPLLEIWTVVTLLLCIFVAWLSPRLAVMRNIAVWVSDQFQVFLVLIVPLTIICILNILFRNLF